MDEVTAINIISLRNLVVSEGVSAKSSLPLFCLTLSRLPKWGEDVFDFLEAGCVLSIVGCLAVSHT